MIHMECQDLFSMKKKKKKWTAVCCKFCLVLKEFTPEKQISKNSAFGVIPDKAITEEVIRFK